MNALQLYYPAWRKGKAKMNCPVCETTGIVLDAKTGNPRMCVACKGDGLVMKPIKYKTA